MSNTLFMYHSGHHALVYANPDKMGFDKAGNLVVQGYFAFPIQILREFGWRINEADVARMLPRFDMPLIAPPTGGMDPKKMKELEAALRSGGRRR